MHAHVDPLDQQQHDPRLLGREELVPQRIGCVSASRASSSVMSSCSARAARHVPTMISGWRKMPRGLDLRRRHAPDRARVWPALQHILADLIAVEPRTFACAVATLRRPSARRSAPAAARRLRPGPC
jgi:hypothetical protein